MKLALVILVILNLFFCRYEKEEEKIKENNERKCTLYLIIFSQEYYKNKVPSATVQQEIEGLVSNTFALYEYCKSILNKKDDVD